ncbi:PREDICTED: glutathione S-transferase T3-like [Camelina sativa]|uniref:Glutathione S-transferase T3-like n=1 Tax=Camelina sativa TaxID=90675 RepID=A0ABM0WPE5_CAMSA|nr:PREDICTED: glutathione S-transferase T3-like [Camelina sativa]
MDSTNPFGFQPPHFMDLLNSQKNSNVYDNSAQTSQPVQFRSPFSSQPIQFSSPFSSQPINLSTQSESEDCIEVIVDDNEEDGGRGSRKRWSAHEDINLISAWLNTSKDPVVSNEQRLNSFWVRVAAYYKSNGGGTASTRKKSGESEDDVIKLAHEIYMNDIKKPFILEHCWRELKHDQKWIMEECSSKRTKLQSDGTYSSSPANDGAEMRPSGVKAAKKKGKKLASVSIDVEDGSVESFCGDMKILRCHVKGNK